MFIPNFKFEDQLRSVIMFTMPLSSEINFNIFTSRTKKTTTTQGRPAPSATTTQTLATTWTNSFSTISEILRPDGESRRHPPKTFTPAADLLPVAAETAAPRTSSAVTLPFPLRGSVTRCRRRLLRRVLAASPRPDLRT